MSKRINSYQAVAAFVRGFFEAYARGIIDATIEGNDFSKKNDPKQIKQMMLEHYGEVNQYFFDIMFSTLVRLNYKTAEEANERMKKNFDSMKQADPTFEPTMLDYLRIACKSNQLYKAMETEYKRISPGFCRASLLHLRSMYAIIPTAFSSVLPMSR